MKQLRSRSCRPDGHAGWRWVELHLEYLRSLTAAAGRDTLAVVLATTGLSEVLQLALRVFVDAQRLLSEIFAADSGAGPFLPLLREQCGTLVLGDLTRLAEGLRNIDADAVESELERVSEETRSRIHRKADEFRDAFKDAATECFRVCDARFSALRKAPLLPAWLLHL